MNDAVQTVIMGLIGGIIVVSIVFGINNYDGIYYSIYGDIEDNQVTPIMTTGMLFGPVLYDQRWVKCYTVGYANSTNSFYIRYEFTYDLFPHKLQYTKWQEAPEKVIEANWENIELFGGSRLPENVLRLNRRMD